MQNYLRKRKANILFFVGVVLLLILQIFILHQTRHLISEKSLIIFIYIFCIILDLFMIALLFYIGIRDKKHIDLQEKYQAIMLNRVNKAEELSRHKSEFLANMSHELRTPLNGIIGFTELICDEKVGPVLPEQKEYLKDILSSAKHLLQLINDILDFAKIETGKLAFNPEKIEIVKLFEEIKSTLHYLLSDKELQLQIEIDPHLKPITLDPVRLKQVIYNYLSNSIKFTPKGGTVTIRFKPENETYFRLEVEDTGVGIAEENLKRMFVEFEQLDQTQDKKYSGTGIGLALTRRIVEIQQGRVGVTSKVGKGSIFYAVLPYDARNMQ